MYKSIDPKDISISQVHGHILSVVAPRPIAFASTVDKNGRVNLSPFSFFNCFGVNPPIMIFSPARRVRDNTTKDTLDNVREVPEVVINIVNYPIVEQMSLSSTEYPKGVNEFKKADLTELASQKIRPPRVAESPASFECVVKEIIEYGGGPGSGNLIICEVVMLHLQEKYLDENGHFDTKKLDLVGRMGANWYCRAVESALFEIPKPLTTMGIGIDQLPESVRNSDVFTGNNLGRMGNLERLPSGEILDASAQLPEVKAALKLAGTERRNALHTIAKQMLEAGETGRALAVAMLANL